MYAVIAELDLHATAELSHAQLPVTRIVRVEGIPVLSPQNRFKLTNCGYDVPSDPYVEEILNQNIKGEQCAIRVCNGLPDITREADPVTYNIILTILSKVIEHEENLAALNEDLELILERRK